MKYTFVYKSSNCNLSESAESSKSKLLARLIPAFSSEYQYLVFHADSKGKLLQSDIIDLAVENLNSDGYSLNSINSAKTRIMNILDKLGAELLPDSTGFLLLRYNNDELFNSFEDALWIQTMFSNDRSEEVIQPKLKSDPTFTLPVYQCKSDKSEVGLWTVKLKGAESPATLANDPKVKISRLFSTTQKSKVKTLIYDTKTKSFSEVKNFAKKKTPAEYKEAIKQLKEDLEEQKNARYEYGENHSGSNSSNDLHYKKFDIEIALGELDLQELELSYKYYSELDEINNWRLNYQKQLDELKHNMKKLKVE